MDEKALRKLGNEIKQHMMDGTLSEQELIAEVKKTPDVVHTELSSGANLFLEAVLWDKPVFAKALAEMGADVHWRHKGSLISGNALNVAHSPEMAEYLLELGLQIEKKLLLSQPYWNPAIKAADHNDTVMLTYWLDKQRALFGDDTAFVEALMHAAVNMITMVNQSSMLVCAMKDDALYAILKEHYQQEDRLESFRLYLRSLQTISDKEVEARKVELRKILHRKDVKTLKR